MKGDTTIAHMRSECFEFIIPRRNRQTCDVCQGSEAGSTESGRLGGTSSQELAPFPFVSKAYGLGLGYVRVHGIQKDLGGGTCYCGFRMVEDADYAMCFLMFVWWIFIQGLAWLHLESPELYSPIGLRCLCCRNMCFQLVVSP